MHGLTDAHDPLVVREAAEANGAAHLELLLDALGAKCVNARRKCARVAWSFSGTEVFSADVAVEPAARLALGRCRGRGCTGHGKGSTLRPREQRAKDV